MTPAFADAEAAARMFGVPVGTVWSWISRYDVPRIPDPHGSRRRLYDLSALEEVASRRRTKS